MRLPYLTLKNPTIPTVPTRRCQQVQYWTFFNAGRMGAQFLGQVLRFEAQRLPTIVVSDRGSRLLKRSEIAKMEQ